MAYLAVVVAPAVFHLYVELLQGMRHHDLENHQNTSTTPIYSSTNHGRLGLRFLIPYLDACKT